MFSFSQLKQKRSTKDTRSYLSTHAPVDLPPELTSMDIDQVQDVTCVELKPGPMRSMPYNLEGLYVSLPQDLEIRVNTAAGKGRGICNRVHRKPGDVLLSINAHVAALSNDHLEDYCSNCFAPGDSLQRCTGCKAMFYCDSACQTTDWLLHKQECAAIQKWSSPGSHSIPGDAIRCLGRILWGKQKLGRGSAWAREIDAMQSHRASLSKDPDSRDSQVHAQLAHAVVRFLGLNSFQEMTEYGMDSAADLVDLISRFTTNTFTISTPALAPLGACVSPIVALLNHSCDPNAVVVFPRVDKKEQEPLMYLVALKHISPEEEVLTAYIDAALSRDIRQKQLRETYHFACQCRLCTPPPNGLVDLRHAMFCSKKCGGVCPSPTEDNAFTRCAGCNAVANNSDAFLDALRLGQEALDKAETLQFSNVKKSIQLTTKFIPILISAGLVPSAHPLLALSRLNASLLITNLPSTTDFEVVRSSGVQESFPESSHMVTQKGGQEALDEAIRAATRVCTGLRHVLLEGHPARGIALAELGKLLCVDEPCPKGLEQQTMPSGTAEIKHSIYPPSGPQRLKLAYETLIQARTELMIGFGRRNEGGEVGKSVRNMVANLEKELAVWKEGIRNAVQDARLASLGAPKK